ncbi:TPA: signal recognition particle-docking protein FtsY [Candidatus Galligastranaerophilus faecipullorum]|nr:signal recognition particle-docking protein FtsY [Candidatus Galligastranaerophilus faecipullorum]
MFNFFKKDDKNIISSGFEALKNALSKTSKTLIDNVVEAASGSDEIDEFTLDDIESMLIKADLGVDLSVEITNKIKSKNLKSGELKDFLKEEFKNILESAGSNKLNYKEGALNIYFVAGVNGAGKTTLIGKLAKRFKDSGKKVLLAAGDTFRAAAEEQLDIWSKRAGVEIVRRDKADSASVVFEAIEKAKKENFDIIIIDTAGRLQNKFNLIEELKKIKNVIEKNAPGALSESILVLDANLGQNGLSQAKVFKEALDLTSVAITKLDGSAKGGIIIAIAKEFSLPAKLVGIGEKADDLKDFDKQEFIEAIFN